MITKDTMTVKIEERHRREDARTHLRVEQEEDHDCDRLSHILPVPTNGRCKVHDELLQDANHRGSDDNRAHPLVETVLDYFDYYCQFQSMHDDGSMSSHNRMRNIEGSKVYERIHGLNKMMITIVLAYFSNFWYQTAVDNGTIANYFQCCTMEIKGFIEKYHVLLKIKDPGTSMLTYESMKPKDMTQAT